MGLKRLFLNYYLEINQNLKPDLSIQTLNSDSIEIGQKQFGLQGAVNYLNCQKVNSVVLEDGEKIIRATYGKGFASFLWDLNDEG